MLKSSQRSSIVVVEDSDDDFDTIEMVIRDAWPDNDLRRVTSADACLSLLRGDGKVQNVWPALVLMDLNIPGSDGREALQDIKDDPRLRAVPVVVFTSSEDPVDLDFCYRAGANAYHVKPVRHEDHIAVLRHVFDYWLKRVNIPGRGEFAH